jgi:hypothetical protein
MMKKIMDSEPFQKIGKQSEDLEERYLGSLVYSLGRLEFVIFNVSSRLTLSVMMMIIFEIKLYTRGYINNLSV